MSDIELLKREFAGVAAMRHFGLELVRCGGGTAEVRMPASSAYAQLEDVVHGGAITTLADTAAVYAIYPDLGSAEMMTSIELKINFLRPGIPGGPPLSARATLLRRGKRVAVSEVSVFQEDGLIAKGLFTYLVLPR